MIRQTLIIFVQEIRLLMKDRQALGLLFLMPMALIIFLTLALQDVYLTKVGRRVTLAVVTDPPCEDFCTQIVGGLKRFHYDVIQVTSLKSPEREGKIEMAVILPKASDLKLLAQDLRGGKATPPAEKIKLLFDPTLDQSLRALVQSHLLMTLQEVLIAKMRTEMSDSIKKLGGAAIQIPAIPNIIHSDQVVEEQAIDGLSLPNPIQYTVPAWALFGMFFIAIPISNSMIRDRNLGIFKRLLSFPVSRTQLLAGRILSYLLINVLQFIVMFSVGVIVLPVLTHLSLALDFGLGSLALVTLLSAAAATAYGLMIACLSKTPEQASAFGALSIVILAILGGVMIPRFVMPAFMQQLSHLSPLYWGLEAYLDVIVRRATFAVAWPKLAALLGFSLIFTIVSTIRFHWNEV